MKKTVVLFFPRIGLPSKWFRLPLSVLSVAAPLVNKGYNVKIVDGNMGGDSLRDLMVAVSNEDVVCLGISAMTGNQVKYGMEAARAVRETAPELPIIWGGWHASLLPAQTAESDLVDIVVKGQGEVTLAEVVHKLRTGTPLAGTTGIVHKVNGEVVEETDRSYVDINSLPRLPYSLIDVGKYVGPDLGTRTLNYCSSTGCPHRCAFCAVSSASDRHWRSLEPQRVIDDLALLIDEFGVNGIRFEDANFFVNRKRVQQICEGLLSRGLRIRWSANARAEQFIRFDDDLLSLIRKSGCVELVVGAESGSQRILDLIEKDCRVEDTFELVSLCERLGIDLILSFMVGVPSEEPVDTTKTLEMIRELQGNNKRKIRCEVLLFFYTAYPGTKLFQSALEAGLISPSSLEGWSSWSLRESNLPWLTSEQQRNLRALAEVYSTERFYLRAQRIVDELVNASSSFSRAPIKVAAKLARWLLRLRVKNRFYHLPIERRLFIAMQGSSKLLGRFIASITR